MIIYPAVDIKSGRCVRLEKGEASRLKDYGDPLEMALKWHSLGATWLHVVDLDGAFSGEPLNMKAVERICAECPIRIQLGGGIRSLKEVDRWMARGVARVVLGTAAIEDPGFAAESASEYPGKVAVGIDVKDGYVAIKGWTELSEMRAQDHALIMKENGINTVIFTDISRDGMMSGPNIELTANLAKETGLEVIASGGIRNIADLKAIMDAGIHGAITGKALYEGTLDLGEALKLQ
jgi:phosphoribosylformimino-5-aminoimidazole carboxamide ribotide isomerase